MYYTLSSYENPYYIQLGSSLVLIEVSCVLLGSIKICTIL